MKLYRDISLAAFFASSLLSSVHAAPTNQSSDAIDVLARDDQPWTFERHAREKWPFKRGYVAFGDSYAAGIGTPRTGGPPCRRGGNNFGRLIYRWTQSWEPWRRPSADFQEHSCSGDTSSGLEGQIDAWENPQNYDWGTVSMGGNDIGFSDILLDCIFTIFGNDQTTKENCKHAKENAMALLEDRDGTYGLFARLRRMYTKILDKSWKSGNKFHLYVTGYPHFFNADTNDCNDVTFYFPGPRFSGGFPDPNNVWLSNDLRREFNDLSAKFNAVIKDAVEVAAADTQRNWGKDFDQIHWVDMDSHFEGHRFCEEGINEPDSGNNKNYFFLSSFHEIGHDYYTTERDPDAYVETGRGTIVPSSSPSQWQPYSFAVDSKYVKDKQIVLPDPATCAPNRDNAFKGADPVDEYMCAMSKAAAADPDGFGKALHESLRAEGAAKRDVGLGSGPNDLVKNFHPRTNGHLAYRNAIVERIVNQAQYIANDDWPQSKTWSFGLW